MIRGQKNGQAIFDVMIGIAILGLFTTIGLGLYQEFYVKTDTEDKGGLKLDQILVNDLRLVTVQYIDDSSEYIIHKDDADRFIEAQKQLYHDLGIDPHSGKKTAQAIAICVSKPSMGGPYWWSTPDLGMSPIYKIGAQILNWYDFEIIWTAPSQ